MRPGRTRLLACARSWAWACMGIVAGCGPAGKNARDATLVVPETCSADPAKPARVGPVRLQLLSDLAGRDCRKVLVEVRASLDPKDKNAIHPVMGSPNQVAYEFTVRFPPFLPAPRTEWLVLPPPLVTGDGVVTAFDDGSRDTYLAATGPGKGDKTTVPVQRLAVGATPDEVPPDLRRLEASAAAVVPQGGHLSLTAAVADGASGLAVAPPDFLAAAPPPLPGPLPRDAGEVALFGLSRPDLGLTLPLWPLSAASQTVDAIVPGMLPVGEYQLYGVSRDQAGNGVTWQGPAGQSAYAALEEPACVARAVPPPQHPTGVPVTIVNVVQNDADRTPPQLQRLSAEPGLAQKDRKPSGDLMARPCEDLVLRMDLSDDHPLPATQQALFWVLPLARPSALYQVPAYPLQDPAILEAHYVLPADAPLGRYLFFPAYAVDATGNPLTSSYQNNALLVGSPLGSATFRSPVPPGSFCVGRCDPENDTSMKPEAATLVSVTALDTQPGKDGAPPSVQNGTVRLRFVFSHTQADKLPTRLP